MTLVQWWHGSGNCLPAELLQAVRFHVWSWLANTTDDRAIAGYRLSEHRLPSCWHQEGAAGPGWARRCREIHRRCRCRSENPNDICWAVQSWFGSSLFHLTLLIVIFLNYSKRFYWTTWLIWNNSGQERKPVEAIFSRLLQVKVKESSGGCSFIISVLLYMLFLTM